MKCPSKGCHEEMEHRTGKFGGFWYCRAHGTISDRGMELIQRLTGSSAAGGLAVPYNCTPESDSLMLQITRETLGFGVRPSELEEWVVDDKDAADYEDDHWMNTRPY